MGPFDERLKEFVDDQVDALGAYLCIHCGEEHVALELAFRWPDLATMRDIATVDEPDDRVTVDGHAFVRGTLRIPIEGAERDFAIGIWVELEDEHHGRIANQLGLLAPLLGARARVVAAEPGYRPTFELIDHPLGYLQRHSVDADTVTRWRSDEAHRGEPERGGEPFVATISVHGWELIDAAAMKRSPCVEEIEPGDLVKIAVRLVTLDPDVGEPSSIVAGWWLQLDLVESDRVSGTLHSSPRIPTTLARGTRMWPRRDQILERAAR